MMFTEFISPLGAKPQNKKHKPNEPNQTPNSHQVAVALTGAARSWPNKKTSMKLRRTY